MADYASDITFTCPNCEENVEILVPIPEPNWAEDKAIDRMTQDEVEVECPECGETYEANVTNWDGHVEMEFTGFPNLAVSCSQGYDRALDFDEDWWLNVPATPEIIFRQSMREADRLLEESGSEHVTNTMNRMVFVHHFSALEAYLSDTLFNAVKSSHRALVNIVSKDVDLKESKIALIEIIEDPGLVMNMVANHLKSQIYHNFSKLSVLFKLSLGVNIFPDEAVKLRLYKGLPVRHDCVHRNGRTKDGVEHSGLSKAYLRELAQDMERLVDHIEASLNKTPT